MMKPPSVPPGTTTATALAAAPTMAGNCLHLSAAEGASVIAIAQHALERNVQEAAPAERIVISTQHWNAPLHLPSSDSEQLQRLANRFGKTVSVKSSAALRASVEERARQAAAGTVQVSWFPKPRRDDVIEALAQDGSATAVRTLLMMLQIGDTSRLPQVAAALRRFQLASVESTLLTTLAQERTEERRGWAALALDQTKSMQAVDALELAAAADPSEFVRNAAIKALREIASPNRFASVFARSFEEPDSFVRNMAMTALGRLGVGQG